MHPFLEKFSAQLCGIGLSPEQWRLLDKLAVKEEIIKARLDPETFEIVLDAISLAVEIVTLDKLQ